MINRVSGASNQDHVYTRKNVQSTEAQSPSENRDVCEIKNKTRLGADEIASLKEEAETAMRNLRELVERLILKQSGLKSGRMEIDEKTVSEAQAAISEDGYYGVKAVSDRIVSFAKAISGNDAGKIEELRAAILKGFEEAAKVWGGELPGICRETYDEVMRKLDDWKKESGSVNITA